jgi:hypothetical protein
MCRVYSDAVLGAALAGVCLTWTTVQLRVGSAASKGGRLAALFGAVAPLRC